MGRWNEMERRVKAPFRRDMAAERWQEEQVREAIRSNIPS